MANEEHLAILKQGVGVWNRWREDNSYTITDLSNAKLQKARLAVVDFTRSILSGADLRGAELSQAELDSADLSHCNLTEANLREANLSNAILTGAILSEAILNGANLRFAYLEDAKFTRAALYGAIFNHAELSGASFRNAYLGLTSFGDCDLRDVKELASIKHQQPSLVSIDTIYKSQGKIPESFLRGCGVPESFITQMHSLVSAEDGIQFYSCFISYSSKHEDFARRLHGQMRDAHLRVWFAPEDIQSGKKLHEQIETAIRVYDKLLIVLSEASLQSEWVMTELRKARKAERQSGKRKLFPVRLVDFETLRTWECFDADSGKDLGVELREYFIPDFSNWKDHDQFEAAFARLLKDLRAEERAK
jgi:uncharacterized protein YjbI with pentapeptide repeats